MFMLYSNLSPFDTRIGHAMFLFLAATASWQGIKVIFSGHEVPGEGEHKIMSHIRKMKVMANYDPNLRHCLYGMSGIFVCLNGVCQE